MHQSPSIPAARDGFNLATNDSDVFHAAARRAAVSPYCAATTDPIAKHGKTTPPESVLVAMSLETGSAVEFAMHRRPGEHSRLSERRGSQSELL
jgi:hypothetical protein